MNGAGDEMKDGPQNIKIGIRRTTREKYETVRRIKRLSYVEVADLAIDALLRSDPELRRSRRKLPAQGVGWHHQVDYSPFKRNRLRLREGVTPKKSINDYGMTLRRNVEEAAPVEQTTEATEGW